MTENRRVRHWPVVIALAVLAALTLVSLVWVQPPRPAAMDAPADRFSAARAFTHVERVGARPHVAGSAAGDQVRDYLLATLRGQGVQALVQDGVGSWHDDDTGVPQMARVRNVVGLLPGTASTGRLYLVAHYDSVQVGPGGNDDGAGVATLLETARALALSRQRNDVVLVFTDAEEACLCGAEAFVSGHPLAASGGVVLNVEARGTGGPVIMFETSAGNARLVDVYGRHAPHPVGTSFAVEVYRILPNDTDFTPFLQSGRFAGLNAAYIEGSAAYHTPQDTPARMDRGSLQAHGDNTLALARAFGTTDLRDSGGGRDATYFPVPGLLVRYPGALVWPLALLALVAVLGLALLARWRGLASWGRLAGGFGLTAVPLLLAPVAVQLGWLAVVAIRPGYADMLDPWRPLWYRLAVLALAGAVLLGCALGARRLVGPTPVAVGGLAWLALLGVLLAAATPGGSYLAALPALAGAVVGLAALAVPARAKDPTTAVWPVVALGAGAAVAVLVLAPTVLLFFPALGLATGGAAAFVATMLGLALLPLLVRLPLRWPALASVGLVLAFAGTGLAVDRFDAAHPAPAALMYTLDRQTGQARWASEEERPGPWTRGYVTGREDLSAAFPVLEKELATGPAPVADLPAAEVRTVTDQRADGRRTLTLQVRPQRTVRLVYLQVTEGRVLSATVDGRDAPVRDGRFEVLFHAPPADGLTVRLELAGDGPLTVRVIDGSDGLDGLPGFRPRPPDVGVKGSHTSELVLVAKTHSVP